MDAAAMNEHAIEDGVAPAAPAGPLTGDSREALLQHLRSALERVEPRRGRTALILVQIDPNYTRRALARWQAVIADTCRGRPERARFTPLGDNRFALVVAPIDQAGHARTLADRLTRALDPRVCPLLRRALPFAWAGVAVSADEGVEAAILLADAEQALVQAREPAPRAQRFAFARRRQVAAALLRPVGPREEPGAA
jgi:hypothetical protein